DADIVGLSELPAGTSYVFQVLMGQTPWTGNAGIVFGFREINEKGKTHSRYHSLALRRMPGNAETYLIEREVNTFEPQPDGKTLIAGELLERQAVDAPPANRNEVLLEIEVHAHGLTNVRWDGQPLPKLCTRDLNAQFGPE